VRGPPRVKEPLEADLARLARDRLLVLTLDRLEDLLQDPQADPFTIRSGPSRPGIDDLALTLCAAGQLPDELTVRVLLPPSSEPSVSPEQAEAALRRRAADMASASWRAAMAVRSMGRRQMPLGLAIAFVSAVVAYGAGYLASTVDAVFARGALIAVAGLAITVAWVVSWMVIESSIIDWRQSSRQAYAYDLLARATLEVTTDTPVTEWRP